jgi:hypothetical protein
MSETKKEDLLEATPFRKKKKPKKINFLEMEYIVSPEIVRIKKAI